MAESTYTRWIETPFDGAAAQTIAAAVNCSPTAARLLVNRGFSTPEAAHAFLNPSFDDLSDPFLLPDAELAAERIRQALINREKIRVHGDYDGDGVTSAALWYRMLARLNADVTVHVPHRHRDGYDIRSAFIAQAKADGIGLIITTDCGIRRVDEVEEAREAGIDVIVTDHHEPGESLPRAVAVVNPHRRDSKYPFPMLAGVGVAYRMGEALVRHLGHPVGGFRRAFADLAAIGTVTDVMPIIGENRIVVTEGLRGIEATKKIGLRALVRNLQSREKLTARDIGFGIGSRLNAAGRVDDSALALQLLLTEDEGEAKELAARLEEANSQRQLEQARILGEALEQAFALDMASTACLVVDGSGWHSGVIGIVAGKLAEKFNRPTIMLATNEETGKARGSARSIRPFNMLDGITACGDHLIEFGGHSHAAGMSMETSSIQAFREAMNAHASSMLTPDDLVPYVEADMAIDASEVTFPLLRELEMFQPWGAGNPEPVFISRSVELADVQRMGPEKQHLKLRARRQPKGIIDVVRWNDGALAENLHPGDRVDMCYSPCLNHFNGALQVQFMLHDIRPADATA